MLQDSRLCLGHGVLSDLTSRSQATTNGGLTATPGLSSGLHSPAGDAHQGQRTLGPPTSYSLTQRELPAFSREGNSQEASCHCRRGQESLAYGSSKAWLPWGRSSSYPKGLSHLPVLLPTLHPQDLSPACPTGVSGSLPPGPSAQLIYGKEGCKQRTRGRRRTKAASLLFAPHWVQSLFTSRCRGGSAQCREPVPICPPRLVHLLSPVGRASLGPLECSLPAMVCILQSQSTPSLLSPGPELN